MSSSFPDLRRACHQDATLSSCSRHYHNRKRAPLGNAQIPSSAHNTLYNVAHAFAFGKAGFRVLGLGFLVVNGRKTAVEKTVSGFQFLVFDRFLAWVLGKQGSRQRIEVVEDSGIALAMQMRIGNKGDSLDTLQSSQFGVAGWSIGFRVSILGLRLAHDSGNKGFEDM